MTKGRDTRRRIIRSTGALFQRQGYDGTGVQEILESSAAPRGSFYFHFPGGKPQLALEAIAAAGAGIGRGIERTLAAHEDAGEAIAAAVELTAADLERSDFHGGCPIAAVTHDTAASSDDIRRACRDVFEGWGALLEARLRRAGWATAAARAESLVILAAMEGGITLGRAARDTAALRALARRCRETLAAPP